MKKIMKYLGIVAALVLMLGFFRSVNTFASTTNGVGTLTLTPGTSNMLPNTPVTVNVVINTSTRTIDGLNFAIDFTGSVPSTITFNFANVSGLVLDFNSTQNITGGKRLLVALGSAAGYTTSNSNVTIGTITFTAPASGTLNANFDRVNSVFAETSTFQDILRHPNNAVYTVAALTPTPTPRATPVVTPNPTPTASGGASPVPGTATFNVTLTLEGVHQETESQPVSLWLKRSDGTVFSSLAEEFTNQGSTNYVYRNARTISFPSFVAGSYEVFLRGPIHLVKSFGARQLNPGANTLALETPALLTGDSYTDNTIGQLDYNRLISSFRCDKSSTTWPAGKDCSSYAADADLDGEVGIHDYSYLVINYETDGDVLPQ